MQEERKFRCSSCGRYHDAVAGPSCSEDGFHKPVTSRNLDDLEKYRLGWRKEAGMVYMKDGPYIEWRHVVKLLKELS
jgi:hypothetical protein